MSALVVTLEYLQATFILIYYWLKSLGRLIFVQPTEKSVQNETILITGAGLCEEATREHHWLTVVFLS